jgi:hypothetical protein
MKGHDGYINEHACEAAGLRFRYAPNVMRDSTMVDIAISTTGHEGMRREHKRALLEALQTQIINQLAVIALEA